ncbi:MAG: hypothetical protein J3K34DRAFT_216400 [Monoraphidium minutum]|nr:MAG: hypothetical protein J3K34DRAFT_216400 [Monoraphidium minutum]
MRPLMGNSAAPPSAGGRRRRRRRDGAPALAGRAPRALGRRDFPEVSQQLLGRRLGREPLVRAQLRAHAAQAARERRRRAGRGRDGRQRLHKRADAEHDLARNRQPRQRLVLGLEPARLGRQRRRAGARRGSVGGAIHRAVERARVGEAPVVAPQRRGGRESREGARQQGVQLLGGGVCVCVCVCVVRHQLVGAY